MAGKRTPDALRCQDTAHLKISYQIQQGGGAHIVSSAQEHANLGRSLRAVSELKKCGTFGNR
jgi:hypothetical protein